jgi:hypothetical protein
MENAIKIVILAVVGLIITLPFFREEETENTTIIHGSEEDRLLSEKESLYAAIKELDFDHEMGKLSDGDYKQLKNEYTEKAVVVLKALDNPNNSGIYK